ncbi:uncharacterized protein TRIADDRAFT_12969, partial [Trichoplax adhaerens]
QRPHLLMLDSKERFGSIYKEAIGSTHYVMVTKPEDVAKVFKVEGKYPSRGPVYPWIIYRQQRKKAKGILIGEGEEWRKSRSVIDKKLLRLKDVSRYSGRMNDVDTSFINLIKTEWTGDHATGEMSNIRNYLFKWSFETINTVLFSKSLGAFNDPPTPIAAIFYDNVLKMLNATNELLFYPPYYKYIKTKYWKQYCGYWDTLFEVGGQLINEARQALNDGKGIDIDRTTSPSRLNDLEFLPYILLRGELTDEEIASNLIELMTAAVDTSANTVLWAFYVLGKHKNIQERIYEEIQSNVKKGEQPDFQAIQNMPYLRGLIKEVQRLIYPVVIFTARELQQNLVLSGYQVPANTLVSVGHYTMSFDETIYEEPNKIKPERWIRSVSNRQTNSFNYIPFGFGPRMCIGRRIAELEMQILVARVI